MCFLIEAMLVSAGDIVASNITAQDHATWSAGTSYAEGDRVCALAPYQVGADEVTGFKVYRSVHAANSGNDPVSDDGTHWLDEGLTNRLKAFDGTIGSQAENAGTVEYTILTTRSCDAIAFFGLSAGSVTVEVYNASMSKIYERTEQLYDTVEIDSIWDWFFSATEYSQSKVFTGLPQGAGRHVKVIINAGVGTAKVGVIALGSVQKIGDTRPGTEIRLEDFSDLNEDPYGNIAPVLRAQIRWVTYRFTAPTKNNEKILRRVIRNTKRLVAVFQGEGAEQFGTLVYGVINDCRLPGESITSEGTLEMRGVV